MRATRKTPRLTRPADATRRDPRFVREALLQERLPGGKARCLTCERRCTLRPGGFGWCRTRQNVDGRLVTLIYGAVSSLAANPIEKKPFFHFYPGTRALTAGSWSCNFACPWCQNWQISKAIPPAQGEFLSPARFVSLAIQSGCQGTSISFNEPVLSLEWAVEVFEEATARGLYNTFVTNGYMTPEALELLLRAGLHAMNVDIKGDAQVTWKYCGAVDVEKVWQACRLARQAGVHLEITTLIIPTVNDSPRVLEGIARRIVEELGPDVPWHLTAYYPAYRFRASPTPLETLETGWELARQAGLRFVYLGNVPGHEKENTYCPGCGQLLVRRAGFDVLETRLREGSCPGCQTPIPGVWRQARLVERASAAGHSGSSARF